MIKFIVTQKHGAKAVYNYLTTTPIPKTLEVTIKLLKRDRSKEQNALFHVWMVYVSQQYYLASGEEYGPEYFKETFKEKYLGKETLDGPFGTITRTRRTRDLSVSEMSDFMMWLTVYCLENLEIELTGLEE